MTILVVQQVTITALDQLIPETRMDISTGGTEELLQFFQGIIFNLSLVLIFAVHH